MVTVSPLPSSQVAALETELKLLLKNNYSRLSVQLLSVLLEAIKALPGTTQALDHKSASERKSGKNWKDTTKVGELLFSFFLAFLPLLEKQTDVCMPAQVHA